MKKLNVVMILILFLALVGCDGVSSGAPDDYFSMIDVVFDIDEMDQNKYPDYQEYRTKEEIDYNKFTDLDLSISYFLVSLFYDLSSIEQHMERYPSECGVKSDSVRDCMLYADQANLYYTYNNDTDFTFQEFYYSPDPTYNTVNGGDFEALKREILFDDLVTTRYFLKGNGSFNYKEYHENNYFLELRGDSEILKEYVWYDIKLDEFIRVSRTNPSAYNITYFKDNFYVDVTYLDGDNPSWIYNNLGTFNEDGNKELNYTFLRGNHTSTMYNLLYLDGWEYIRYERAREFYITDEEKTDIHEIYDANQIYIKNSELSLEELGLSLNISVMSPNELETRANSELSEVLNYFGIEFHEDELSKTYLDLINIEMVYGLNEKND